MTMPAEQRNNISSKKIQAFPQFHIIMYSKIYPKFIQNLSYQVSLTTSQFCVLIN